MGRLEYTLSALVIVIALSIALELFLSEYLLYHIMTMMNRLMKVRNKRA